MPSSVIELEINGEEPLLRHLTTRDGEGSTSAVRGNAVIRIGWQPAVNQSLSESIGTTCAPLRKSAG